MVRGAKCANCIRKIEGGMLALPGVEDARLNLSTGRLRIVWRSGDLRPAIFTETLANLGYDAAAFDPEKSQRAIDEEGRFLLRCLAVAGFGAMNVMMFTSPIWFGADMEPATLALMHWFAALVAIPVALYSGRPFYRSAYKALRAGGANMDVPISLAVLLTLGMSLYETMNRGPVAYFDGAVMLLFLLLIGRYLDHNLRERARTAAKDLLALQSVTATRLESGGARAVAARELHVGDVVLLAPGERAAADGSVVDGESELDCALLTGESAPVPVKAGEAIRAGVVNLLRPLQYRVTAPAERSTVAELARLIEIGEQGRAKFVRIADKAAALYVPIVHTLAALTFLGWMFGPALLRTLGLDVADIGVRGALMNAVAVLIITCPCALGLAVPAVQVVATGRLFRRGVLVKSGDALERLANVDKVVLDKTGTLTLGRPRLSVAPDEATLIEAAALARISRHPLSRALVEAAGPGAPAKGAHEVQGEGLEFETPQGPARLGRRLFAAPDMPDAGDGQSELWFSRPGVLPARFTFSDGLRPDARAVMAELERRGLAPELLSGDRTQAVAGAAGAAGLTRFAGAVGPADKTARLRTLKGQGAHVLMLGDGLNDAAALAGAYVSASPGSALDVSQAASDIVVEGDSLAPIIDMLDVAKAARARVLENMGFSALYNLAAVPFAVMGFVTPLIAAVAMASSSLIVTLNALRLQGGRAWTSPST
jgi:Cu2+-exporting ATPase